MLLISKTLPYSFCACVRNTHKIVTFVIGKMELVSFSLFLDAFPPRPKMPFTYVENVYSDMSLFVIMSTRENIRLIARTSFAYVHVYMATLSSHWHTQQPFLMNEASCRSWPVSENAQNS